MTDQEIMELRERNEKRLQEAKKKLGSMWLLHPDNHVKKSPQPITKTFYQHQKGFV